MAEVAWPSAVPFPGEPERGAEFSQVGQEPYRPGRVVTEPGLVGRPHIIERGRRYWRVEGSIAATDSEELTQKITQALAQAQVGSADWLPVPLDLPSFADGGADGGTQAGAITVTAILQTAGGVTGIKLSPANPGKADAVNGVLRREPRVGDWFIVVSGGVERLVQVSGWATAAGEDYGVLDFEEDLQLSVAVGDTVKAPADVRMQADGDVQTIQDSDGWGPWDVAFVEYIPDPATLLPDRAPARLYDLPDVSGRVGDDVPLRLSAAWRDPGGGELTLWVQSDEGVDVEDSGTGQYTLALRRAGRYTVTARATTEGGDYDEQSFEVAVGPRAGSAGPRVKAIVPAVSVTQGQSVGLVGENHIESTDDSEMSYEVNVSDVTVARPSPPGGVLSVEGVRPGVTRGQLVGTDASGNAVSVLFPIEVGGISSTIPGVDATGPPTIKQAFDALTLTAATPPDFGEQYTYSSLYSYFADPNNEPLAFTHIAGVNASGNAIIAVQIVGAELRITPLPDTGTVNLTVTATNRKRNLSVSQTFAVTVEAAANRAPIWNGPETQILGTAAAGAGTADNPERTKTLTLTSLLGLNPICRDPDGDDLTFAVRSVTPANIVTATISGDDVVLTRAAALADSASGAAEVTIRATDDGTPALSADRTFRVECRAATGTAPAPDLGFNENHSSLAPVPLTVPGRQVTRDIEGAITGRGARTVRVEAESDDRTVATAEMDGFDLEITPAGIGTATVTVEAWATTGNTARVTTTVEVTVTRGAGPPVPRFTGPSKSDVALVLGTDKAVDIDDHCTVDDGSAITYGGASSSRAKFTLAVGGTRNKDFTLSPVAVTTAGQEPTLFIRAKAATGGTNTYRVEVPITEAAEPPVGTGIQTTAIADFPRRGVWRTIRHQYCDVSPNFTPGTSGRAVDWPNSEVEQVSGSNVATLQRLITTGARPGRVVVYARSTGVARFRVRAAEAGTGRKTAWVYFNVRITASPPVARPTIDGIGNRRVTQGQTLNVGLGQYTTYSGQSSALSYTVLVERSTGGRIQTVARINGSTLVLGGANAPAGEYRITAFVYVTANVLVNDGDTFNLTIE